MTHRSCITNLEDIVVPYHGEIIDLLSKFVIGVTHAKCKTCFMRILQRRRKTHKIGLFTQMICMSLDSIIQCHNIELTPQISLNMTALLPYNERCTTFQLPKQIRGEMRTMHYLKVKMLFLSAHRAQCEQVSEQHVTGIIYVSLCGCCHHYC